MNNTKQKILSFDRIFVLEAPPRFELGRKGVADLCLTTWLWCRKTKDAHYLSVFLKMERKTRFELATFTLAR